MFRGIGLWLLGVPIWLIIIIVLFLRYEKPKAGITPRLFYALTFRVAG